MRHLVLMLALILGCSRPSHGHAPDAATHPSATTDAASAAVRLDGSAPPSHDGSTSAAIMDAGAWMAPLDASTKIIPFDAAPDLAAFDKLTWSTPAWTPASCMVQVSNDVASLEELHWARATGTGAASCMVLPISGQDTMDVATVHPAGGYTMRFTLPNDPSDGHPTGTVYVLYDMQGKPQHAVRVSGYCDAQYSQGESDGCWLFTFNDFMSTRQQGLGCGGNVEAPAQTFDLSEVLFGPQVTDHVVFVHGDSSSHGLRFDRSQPTQPVSVSELYSPQMLGAHDTSVVALMSYKTTTYEQTLYRLDGSGVWQLLHDPKPRVGWVLHTDDKNIAWVETDSAEGFEHRDGTLYLAPWPAPGSALVPRNVRIIHNIGRDEPFALRHSYFAHAASSTVDLYRTSDGLHWTVPLPTGFHRMLYTGLWLDDSYVTYTVDIDNDAGASSARSLVRCPVAEIVKGMGD